MNAILVGRQFGKRERMRILKQAREELLVLNDEYDPSHEGAGIDERFNDKLQIILVAEDPFVVAKKVKDSFLVHLLAEVSKGNIEGRPSAQGYLKKANKARSLAKMFQKKGDEDGASKQLARAENFEKLAQELAEPELSGA